MKKTFVLIVSVFFALQTFGGGNGVTKNLKWGKSVLEKGFYLNIGLSFPSYILSDNGYIGTVQNVGKEPNIELGNQWYFWKNQHFGFGLRVSWLQFGAGAYSPSYSSDKFFATDIRLFKVIPQFTFAFTDALALDLSFEVSPTAYVGSGILNNQQETYYALGAMFAPGARFRYNMIAVGADFGFGSLPKAQFITNDVGGGNSNTTDFKLNTIFSPRVYVGFQF
jgi:hypothetical protein